jgi:hypothetical protein
LALISRLRVAFTPLQGQVFQLTLTKSFWSGWIVDVVMILNGKSGPILALSPLIPCLTVDHPIESAGLVAMCLAHLVHTASPPARAFIATTHLSCNEWLTRLSGHTM